MKKSKPQQPHKKNDSKRNQSDDDKETPMPEENLPDEDLPEHNLEANQKTLSDINPPSETSKSMQSKN